MGYASLRTCHVTAEAAAADTCAALVFGYSEGAAACGAASVAGDLATYTIAYAPSSGAPYTGTLEQTLQPCEPLTVQDGVEAGWLVLSAVISAGCILALTRAFR